MATISPCPANQSLTPFAPGAATHFLPGVYSSNVFAQSELLQRQNNSDVGD
jgi:hypothetical protein